MKTVKRFAAVLIAAITAVVTLAVPASAYDYSDYLRDAAPYSGVIYTDYQLARELGETITKTYRDYWTAENPFQNFYDGIDKLADENDGFFDACMTEVLKIQRENSDNGMRLARPGEKNSKVLAEQIAFAETLTGKTGIKDTVLETVINSKKEYFNGATDAMISFTDQYSRFIAAKDYYADENTSTVGLGITSQNLGSSILVQKVFTGGGAEAAGIVRGDVIIKINGKPVDTDTYDARGEENSTVKVTVLHPDNTTEELTVKRILNNPGKMTVTRKDETMIVSFKEFTLMSDAEDFEKYYDEATADPKITKFVIDLRDNTGGDVEVLDAICSVLTKKGELIYTVEDRTTKEPYYSKGKYKGAGVKFGGEIFVLTNRNSASASDVVTAVVKNIGGTQVGEPTYGKGIGQIGNILHNGYMAWVTGLYMNIPNFGLYHGTPFKPDVPIPQLVAAFTKDEYLPLEDTKSPLTPDSPKERIMAYQQRLQSFSVYPVEITGELDARTIWLSDAVCWLSGIKPSKNGVISGEMVGITARNAEYAGLDNIKIFSETDDALQYCLDYGEEAADDKAA
jgi:C-terminal peptidase prc